MGDIIHLRFVQKGIRAAQYTRDIEGTRYQPYEAKFASFLRLCEEGAAQKFDAVIVAFPEVLGDTYDELIANLSHAAKAGLAVGIAGKL